MELAMVDPWYSNDPSRFDLGMLDWGAGKYRDFLDVFENSLGPDNPPQYSLSWQIPWGERRVQWRRYRLLVLMLLTLRGAPATDSLFGGGSSDDDSVPMRMDSDSSFLDYLVILRHNCPALSEGDFRPLITSDEDIFGYVREIEMQRMVVLLNFAGYELGVQLQGSVGAWIAGTHEVYGNGLPPDGGQIVLQPYEGRVYELRRVLP